MEEDACRERTPRAAAIKVAAAMVIVVVAAADRAERMRERERVSEFSVVE